MVEETVVRLHFKFHPNRTKTLVFRRVWVGTCWNRELRAKASITLKPTKLRGFLSSSLHPGWELTDCHLGGFRCYLVIMLEGKAIFMNIKSELAVYWMKENVWTRMGQIKSVDNLETYEITEGRWRQENGWSCQLSNAINFAGEVEGSDHRIDALFHDYDDKCYHKYIIKKTILFVVKNMVNFLVPSLWLTYVNFFHLIDFVHIFFQQSWQLGHRGLEFRSVSSYFRILMIITTKNVTHYTFVTSKMALIGHTFGTKIKCVRVKLFYISLNSDQYHSRLLV